LHDKFGLGAEKTLFWEDDMKANSSFPEPVEYKSCTATIYRQKNRDALRYEVRYYDVDGSMQRVTFPTNTSAKKFAEAAVREIATNREHFITLRGRDAFEYQTAIQTLAPLGLTIAQGATLIAENQRQLGGQGTLPEAIKYFRENRPRQSPDITPRRKRSAGISALFASVARTGRGLTRAPRRCTASSPAKSSTAGSGGCPPNGSPRKTSKLRAYGWRMGKFPGLGSAQKIRHRFAFFSAATCRE
jgi:hypothetical protein